ncbi:MAG: chorismate synthase [Acidobacteria bacterium]|nr:chorismate synthase [Acidobacteriota bacterium]
MRFLTAGESHGPALTVIVDGLPAGLPVDLEAVDRELRRRQGGYGRGQRMAIESDRAEVLAGLRAGETIGSPVALLVRNKDWTNWQRTMHADREPPPDATGARRAPVTRPRPGHADLAGGVKYDRDDLRDVLERASARETAARVAAGALARQLLARFGVDIVSHVVAVGGVSLPAEREVTLAEIRAIPADARLRCIDPGVEAGMVDAIDAARAAGDTVGGAFEVVASGVPPGLGSHVQWDRKLDGRLAQALMSIPAIKAVGIGLGPTVADRPGSRVHDEIVVPDVTHPASLDLAVARPTNRAGGLEGGITNGEPVRVSAFMKPISTLMKPLRSVDLRTLADAPAAIERSDVCAVPAAAVVGEAMVALVLADAFLEKFGADTVGDITRNLEAVRARVRERFGRARDDATRE